MLSAHMPPLPLERKPFGKQTTALSTQRLPSPKKHKIAKASKESQTTTPTSKVKKTSLVKVPVASTKQVTYKLPTKPIVVTVDNNKPMDYSTIIVVTPEMREYYLNEERQLTQFIHNQMNISDETAKNGRNS